MKKEGLIILVILFSISFVMSSGIDSEINKLTNYAEEYETGNINYVQFLIYSSAIRQRMNVELGALDREHGGVLTEKQLESALGKGTETTEWVWVEKEEKEKRFDKEIPVWRKIIFDGKKIQILLNAWPSLFVKNGKEQLVYRLNIETNFKRAQEELNMQDKISNIKNLAEIYNKDPSQENAESLAKESANAEKTFESFYRQNQGKCEDIMSSIIGGENRMPDQNMLVYKIDFYKGEKFDGIIWLEMCDECEWNWVNVNFWIEGRGIRQPEPEKNFNKEADMPIESLKSAIKETVTQIHASLENGDYTMALSLNNKLMQYNEIWNRKSNDVWKQIDQLYPKDFKNEQKDEYYWIKEEQSKKQKEKELRKINYEEKKQFYLDLFSEYDKKEFYYTQIRYEKRLVEAFQDFGKELCDNNKDDNSNEQIDCADEQCLGKICGRQKISISDGNETREEFQELYCIQGICQAKADKIISNQAICGNHICEENETDNCLEDCSNCTIFPPLNCSGQTLFSGVDGLGCPLPPICLNETNNCEKDEDCIQPLCGVSQCLNNECEITEIQECKEAECNESEEVIHNCNSGEEIIFEKCLNGVWIQTGAECSGDFTENILHEEILGEECIVKEDCGNENDVCSNGRCIQIPESIRINEQGNQILESENANEISEEPQNLHSENNQDDKIENQKIQESDNTKTKLNEEETESAHPEIQEPQEPTGIISVTGFLLKKFNFKILSYSITGHSIEEGGDSNSEPVPVEEPLAPEPQTEEPSLFINEDPQPNPDHPVLPNGDMPESADRNDFRPEDERRENEDNQRERENERRQEEERERRKNECETMCKQNCERNLIIPCVRPCIEESNCGNDCDKATQDCREKCKSEKDTSSCENDCVEKCLKGENFWEEPKQEEKKMEKGVYMLQGECRNIQQKTDAFIFFGGWGDPFEEVQFLKEKYRSGGEADWCKQDLENLEKQREEFEKGFNEELTKWFFEKYLANSAEDWEGHISGIFELYWKDVELSKQMMDRMNCLGKNALPKHNLINVSYEAEYGKLEFWEENKKIKMPQYEQEIEVISPYMKIWFFPPREFIISEMKKSMKNHEFPGSPEEQLEREKENGLNEEEIDLIKQNKAFMKKIKQISDKYNGNVDVTVQFKDFEKDEVIFNLYVQINENDILKMEPMLPEEIPEQDINIEIDFDKIYSLIDENQRKMEGERIESPPWDKKAQPSQKIKEVVNGVEMYFKVNNIINSARITPKSEEADARKLIKEFFSMMNKEGKNNNPEENNEEKPDENEQKIFESKDATGKVILNLN
ncbi:MAG: hypothetical protein ACOYT4_04455 [Nanoarchaeota archaeon]